MPSLGDRKPKDTAEGARGRVLGGFKQVFLLKDREREETTQGPSMTYLAGLVFTLLVGVSLLAFFYTRRRGGSLTNLRRPEPSSFWLGIFHEFFANVLVDFSIKVMRNRNPTSEVQTC